MPIQENETYLGDAVYASVVQTNGMIKLRCEAPSEPGVLYMEEEVLSAFMKFIARTYGSEGGR